MQYYLIEIKSVFSILPFSPFLFAGIFARIGIRRRMRERFSSASFYIPDGRMTFRNFPLISARQENKI